MRVFPRLFFVSSFVCAALFTFAACGGSSSAPIGSSGSPGSCADISGTWRGSFANSCDGTGTGEVTVAQSGCSVSSVWPHQTNATGTIDGDTFSVSLTFAAPCRGTGSATGTIEGGTISGTYSGTSSCCANLSGTFSLAR